MIKIVLNRTRSYWVQQFKRSNRKQRKYIWYFSTLHFLKPQK